MTDKSLFDSGLLIGVENSHLPFRRIMSRRKLASVHANIHNHLNQERHIVDRQTYRKRCSGALADLPGLPS
jgi:putative transposase